MEKFTEKTKFVGEFKSIIRNAVMETFLQMFLLRSCLIFGSFFLNMCLYFLYCEFIFLLHLQLFRDTSVI